MTRMKTLLAAVGIFMATPVDAADSPLKPSNIDFAEPLSAARTRLASVCETVSEQEITPAQIPGTKDRQVQLNCHGYTFQGAPRKAEFVYRDGDLMLVWILTSAEEEQTLETWMQGAAPVSHKAKEFTAFTSQNMALRKVPHEVLFYSDRAAPMFEAWFNSAAGSQ